MTSLLAELKRRNVYKVAFAYLILGWLVLQITDIVAPALLLPDWTMTLVTFLGIIGFPFAMLFTWAFELTPDGLKRTGEIQPEQSITSSTGKTLNGMIIAMMALAIVFLMIDRFVIDGQAPSAELALDSETNGAGTGDAPHSIAVLPFVNMSKDPDQEYFSDGISEELLNGLAKLDKLRVAARTSSFAFKGKNEDITAIGKQLNVATVLEGSVRKAGQRVRITAQLINVEDGYHLWSETYDRELNDIFAIQDEISQAIVDALKVHLTDADVEIVAAKQRPTNLDAYNFYLLGRHSLRQRTAPTLQKAQLQYQKAIDIDPGYAAAWAGKATATELLSQRHYGNLPVNVARDQARQLVDMALRLEPGNPEALATQALLDLNHSDAYTALASLELAIAANPSEGILYSWQADALNDTARFDEARRSQELSFRIDPLHRVTRRNLAMLYALNGQAARAREMIAAGELAYFETESFIALSEGRYADRERILSEGISQLNANETEILIIMRGFNRFYRLQAIALAYEGVPESMQVRFDSETQADHALARIEALPKASYGRRIYNSHLNALLISRRYAELLELLAERDVMNRPLWGDVSSANGQFGYASYYALALKRTGRADEARQLAQKLLDYVALAVANGQPPDYLGTQAVLHVLMDDYTAAIASLRIALQNFDLSSSFLNAPWFDEIRENPEFLEIQQALLDHVNAERAELGWDALEVAAL